MHTLLLFHQQFQRSKLDILDLSSHSCHTYVSLYSGKPSGSRSEAVVGLFLTTTAIHALLTWKPVFDRNLTARFWPKLMSIIIVQCYPPTKTSDIVQEDAFYKQLLTFQKGIGRIVIVII